MQLVRRPDERRLERVPARRVRAGRYPPDLVVVHPDAPRRPHVLRPLVLRAAEPADAQDQDLARAIGQRRAGPDVGRLHRPRAEEDRVAGQRGVEIEHRAAGAAGIEQAADLVGPYLPRQRTEPRGVETHRGRAGRPGRALDAGGQAVGEPLVRLHAEGVGQRRQQDELRAAEDRVDDLRRVVARRQRVPGGVAQERVAVQLVHRAQHQGVPRPPARLRPFRHPAQVGVPQAEAARLGGQLRPQRLGTAQPGGAQPHQELIDGRRHGALPQVGGERSEAVQRRRMPGQRPQQVGRPLRLDAERRDPRAHVVGPRGRITRGDRRDPRRGGCGDPILRRGGRGRARHGDRRHDESGEQRRGPEKMHHFTDSRADRSGRSGTSRAAPPGALPRRLLVRQVRRRRSGGRTRRSRRRGATGARRRRRPSPRP